MMARSPRRVVFVADSHLPHEVDAVEALISYVTALRPSTAGIYFLGDVFCYAVGLPGFRTPALDLFIAHIDELLQSGLDVGFVAGNRDFYFDRILPRHPRLSYSEDALHISPFGHRLHLAHGDTINRSDRQYLLWRRLSRSGPMRLAVSLLPTTAARALGDRLERTMRSTNAAYRIAFPERACRSYGERAVAAGASRVLLGHFHDPRAMDIDAHGSAGVLNVVPDWLSRRTHAELWDDGRFVLDAAHASHP